MSDEELWEAFTPLAAEVSIRVHRRFRRVLELEDVHQYCWIWALERKKSLRELVEAEDFETIERRLENWVRKNCNQEKAAVEGYDVNDLTWYNREGLRTLLDSMFDDAAWTEPPVSDSGPGSGGDPAYGGNWLATLADVSRAFKLLKDEDKILLTHLHRAQMTQTETADLLDVDQSNVSRRHDRALDRLLDLLGGPRPEDEPEREYTGKRKSKSNGQAMAETRNQYDE